MFFTRFLTSESRNELIHLLKFNLSLSVKRIVVGLLTCSIKMSGSKPKLKVRTLDEMFKKISESSENDPEQLAHTSENSPALSLIRD